LKIPNADQAIIDPAKLRDYLLSPSHPIGRFKAVFFHRLGYTQSDWQRLELDLRSQHLPMDARQMQAHPFGQTYEIAANLAGPSGMIAVVSSIWIVLDGEDRPRLITAYPGPTT